MKSNLLLNIEECQRLRRKKGLSQDELAYACQQRRLRISLATIKRAETGKPVSHRTARELAAFYDVELKTILITSPLSDLDNEVKIPSSAESNNHSLLTILWLRIDDREAASKVMNLLQNKGSLWLEQLGNGITATFGDIANDDKGYLRAQIVLLEVRKLLREKLENPVHFYAALQLGLVPYQLETSGLAPHLLQWFAQHSTSIPVDSIMVSPEIYNMSNSHFNFLPHKVEDTSLWLLQSLKSFEQNLLLHGRLTELQQINKILNTIETSSDPVITNITGPAGIGKSRLLREIHEQASTRNILIADIDLEAGWNDPVELLTATLCQRLLKQVENKITRNQLKEILFNDKYSIGQQSIFIDLLGIKSIDFDELYFEYRSSVNRIATDETSLATAVAMIISGIVKHQKQSLLISIDNLHFAGHSGRVLFKQILNACKQLPLVCVTTSRIETDSNEIFTQLTQDGFLVNSMSLEPLADTAMESICSAYGELEKNYKSKCIKLAEGIPLYLIQLLTRQGEQCNEMPSSIKLLVEQKILKLNDTDRRVLELLSVCDAPLPLTSIEALLDKKGYSPKPLINLQLVKVDVEFGIMLCHQVVRLIIYRRISEKARCAYHRVIAEYIEQWLGLENFNGSQAPSLARHYEKSNQFYKSAQYNFLAASEMLLLNLYPKALVFLEKALILLKQSGHEKKEDLEINIQLELCSIYKVKYGWVSSLLKTSYQRIEVLCERLGSDKRIVLALFGQWTIELSTLNFKNAESLANKCLTISKQLNDNQGVMQANVALSNTLFWRGKHIEAEKAARNVLALYRPEFYSRSIQLLGQDPRVLAGCFGALSASILQQDDKAELYRTNLMLDARKEQHSFSLAIALQGSTWLDFHLNNPGAVLNQASELESLSIKMSFPFYRGVAALFIGWSKHKLGQDQQAAHYVSQGYNKWLVSSGDKLAYSLYCIILGEIYIDTERYRDARVLLKYGIELAILQDERCYLPEMYRLLAFCVNDEQRDSLLQKALSFSQESPLFTSRIKSLIPAL